MRVLVVLPTYNEAENIDHVLRRIRAAMPDAGVLVVDDGSPDGTADLAEKLGDELGHIDVLRRTAKSGLGSAYRAGFAWGLERGWEAFVEMDADLSHEPEALPSLVAPLAEGVDLVVGSRYVPGGSIPNWRWHRRLLSQGGNVYAALLLRLHVSDSTSGFRAYRADALRRIDLERRAGRGIRVPDRDGPPGAPARRPGHRGAHPVRRPGGGQVEDVDAHRGRGSAPRDLVGLPSGPGGSLVRRRRRRGPGRGAAV